MKNLEGALNGRALDYIVVHHMEPDHSATLFDTLNKYPGAKVVCNAKTIAMIEQFFGKKPEHILVKEGDTLSSGKHQLTFVFAPMVHWPEVMMTYDSTAKILFSADAFGTFGALNGAIFADEVDFDRDYLDEARRYYCNIVGKYGTQVQAVLKKASALDIKMIAPLHGFVWRENLGYYIEKYNLWSSYTPEVKGVMLAYASIYGNTELAANILACRLREAGVPLVMYDTSVTDHSHILAEAFKYSHLVLASPTYNGGAFSTMEHLLRDIAAHGLKNRKLAFLENGTWAAMATKQMKAILEPLSGTEFITKTLVLKSAIRQNQKDEL
jgi:flavorubredoxin